MARARVRASNGASSSFSSSLYGDEVRGDGDGNGARMCGEGMWRDEVQGAVIVN